MELVFCPVFYWRSGFHHSRSSSDGMIQTAEITRSGERGKSEPYAKLEDGRTMPMGWNRHQVIPVGTKGTAEYVRRGNFGLWQFTPEEPEPDHFEGNIGANIAKL